MDRGCGSARARIAFAEVCAVGCAHAPEQCAPPQCAARAASTLYGCESNGAYLSHTRARAVPEKLQEGGIAIIAHLNVPSRSLTGCCARTELAAPFFCRIAREGVAAALSRAFPGGAGLGALSLSLLTSS